MRRAKLLVAASILAALAVPGSARAMKCAEIRGVGDPCAKVCQTLPSSDKLAFCHLA